MEWKQFAKQEPAGFDLRIVLVFMVACLVIVSYDYAFKSPLNYMVRLFQNASGDEMSLYQFFAWHLKTFIMLFVVPLSAMVLLDRCGIRRYSPVRYTFTLGDHKMGVALALLFAAVTVSIHYILVLAGLIRPDFYPLCKSQLVMNNLIFFLLFEISQCLNMVGFEYFFRGFLLIEAEKIFGRNALVVTLLPYIIIKFGKPALEVYTAIPVGIALGYITLKTRSFWYAALAHGLLATSVDILSVYVK